MAEEHAFDVVTREAPGGLGQVVGAEGEEVSFLSDGVGADGGTRQLDHAADGEVELVAGLGANLSQHLLSALAGDL